MASKVAVSAEVLEGIEHVRDNGHTDMWNVEEVIGWADMLGEGGAADWIERHRREYVIGMATGFAVVNQGGAA